MKSPALWGTKAHLDKLFGAKAKRRGAEPGTSSSATSRPQHWLEIFRDYYGPVLKAFAALDAEARRTRFEADIDALLEKFNAARTARSSIPSEYLEVVITKRK